MLPVTYFEQLIAAALTDIPRDDRERAEPRRIFPTRVSFRSSK
ncbi:MAG TPA: hypothetical protein VMJ49_07200 [Gaiellaceae bacterium]|nr:hypothetical protein [Gaiellaceae bacterium]